MRVALADQVLSMPLSTRTAEKSVAFRRSSFGSRNFLCNGVIAHLIGLIVEV
jgi:hypothetical protein